jgi:hypothetical protein
VLLGELGDLFGQGVVVAGRWHQGGVDVVIV